MANRIITNSDAAALLELFESREGGCRPQSEVVGRGAGLSLGRNVVRERSVPPAGVNLARVEPLAPMMPLFVTMAVALFLVMVVARYFFLTLSPV